MATFAKRIRSSVQLEIDAASKADARDSGDFAFRHLERAHVLGQAAIVEHVRVHWLMFRWALRHRRRAGIAIDTAFWQPQATG